MAVKKYKTNDVIMKDDIEEIPVGFAPIEKPIDTMKRPKRQLPPNVYITDDGEMYERLNSVFGMWARTGQVFRLEDIKK